MEPSSRNKLVAALVIAGIAVGGYFLLTRSDSTIESPAEPVGKGVASNRRTKPPRPHRPAVSVAPPVSVPSKPRAAPSPNVVASASWGSGDLDIGRNVPDEGNPEGPMSFTVAPDGTLIVLDQINGRLARYDKDGNRLSDTRLDATYPQDVAVGADGTTVVLDRLKDKELTILDPEGRKRGAIPLDEEALGETGGVTGVFVDGEDVWVEKEHGKLVKAGKTDGTPAGEEPEEVPGRPSRDGTLFLSAGLVDPDAGRILVSAIDRATRDHQFTRSIQLADSVMYLVLLDSDKQGTIYVAALIGTPEPPRGDVQVQLVCLEPSHGEPMGGAFMPANVLADETFRDLVVLDNGGVLYAERTEQGVTYRLYQCSQ